MKAKYTRNHREYGNAILGRLGELDTGIPPGEVIQVPSGLKPAVAAFLATHLAYGALCDAADAARLTRDESLQGVSSAATAVANGIDALAVAAVTAGLGTRTAPLKTYTNLSVTALKKLKYGRMSVVIPQVLAKMRNVRQVKPQVDALKKAIAALATALAGYSRAQTKFQQAMKKRDAYLPTWQRALDLFKLEAGVAWFDAPETMEAVFAPAPALVEPAVKHQAKKQPPGDNPPAQEQAKRGKKGKGKKAKEEEAAPESGSTPEEAAKESETAEAKPAPATAAAATESEPPPEKAKPGKKGPPPKGGAPAPRKKRAHG